MVSTIVQTGSISKSALWAGRIISGLVGLFLLTDAVFKFIKPKAVVEGTVSIGYSESAIVPIGAALLISTILYLIPRTSVLGAILLVGYLGGAVATHVIARHGWFEITFPVIFGALAWLGLYLRDQKLRELVPIRNS